MKKTILILAAVLCSAWGSGAFAAMDAKAMKAEKDKIEAAYKADKAKCDALKANAKDICKAEAKGREKVAKAELDAQNKPGPAADAKVKMAKADADYDVAKEKCEDMKGKEMLACKKTAKDTHSAAKGGAKAEKKAKS